MKRKVEGSPEEECMKEEERNVIKYE